MIRHREDDVHRPGARRHDALSGDSEPGVRLIEVLNRDRLPFARAGSGQSAWLRVVEPFIRERVAIRIARTFRAEIDALAGLGEARVRIGELRNRRMVGLIVRLDRPVHSGGEVVLIRGAPTPDRRVVARVPLAVDTTDLVDGVAPERPRFRFLKPLLACAACTARSVRPSRPNPDAPEH